MPGSKSTSDDRAIEICIVELDIPVNWYVLIGCGIIINGDWRIILGSNSDCQYHQISSQISIVNSDRNVCRPKLISLRCDRQCGSCKYDATQGNKRAVAVALVKVSDPKGVSTSVTVSVTEPVPSSNIDSVGAGLISIVGASFTLVTDTVRVAVLDVAPPIIITGNALATLKVSMVHHQQCWLL